MTISRPVTHFVNKDCDEQCMYRYVLVHRVKPGLIVMHQISGQNLPEITLLLKILVLLPTLPTFCTPMSLPEEGSEDPLGRFNIAAAHWPSWSESLKWGFV